MKTHNDLCEFLKDMDAPDDLFEILAEVLNPNEYDEPYEDEINY